MLGRLSSRVAEFLSQHGWHAGRDARELVSQWEQAFFAAEPFELSAPARRVLLSLGGLEFEQDDPGETVARTGFRFDPTLASGEADRFSDFEGLLDTRLCPVGEANGGYSYLAVAEDGRVLCIWDDAWIIGETIEEALESLVLGRRGLEIHAPEAEKIGGAILLRQLTPPLLLGSCACLLSGPERGWTVGAFFPDEEEFRLACGQDHMSMGLSFDVALQFAGALKVTSLQGLALAPGDSGAAEVHCTFEDPRRSHPVSLVLAVAGGTLRHRRLDDQVELRLAPALAEACADALFELLARRST